jgi:OOP family OmpA-OmpF porin
MTLLGYSGGDITEVTAYETYDTSKALEEATPYIEYEPVTLATPTPSPIVEMEPVTKFPTKKQIYPSGFYVGLGITSNNYNDSCKCGDTPNSIHTKARTIRESKYGVLGRVGYDFNRYVGIEARLLRNISDGDDFSLSHMGLFVKPMYPIGNITNIYALLGFAKTTIKGNIPKMDTESMAYGAGVELDLSEDVPRNGRYSRDFDGEGDQEQGIGLFIDYERLVAEKNTPNLDTFTAGVTYDF